MSLTECFSQFEKDTVRRKGENQNEETQVLFWFPVGNWSQIPCHPGHGPLCNGCVIVGFGIVGSKVEST